MRLDSMFLPNNLHHESVELFASSDPHLRRLRALSFVHRSRLLGQLPVQVPGIYMLGGGRQVGKTTLLKQWMLSLLHSDISPERILFLTGEMIDDHHVLVRLVRDAFGDDEDGSLRYLLLDEVTYINGWDRGVKYLADTGHFDKAIVIITSSDLTFLREARLRFPGRRGKAGVVDFHLYPLSFGEVLELQGKIEPGLTLNLAETEEMSPELMERVFQGFEDYLLHGGYLPAINDMASEQRILPATLATYAEWIRGDMLKRGKREHLLRELLGALIAQYGSQVTWNSLTGMISIDHHQTVSEYIRLLQAMEALFVQHAIIEDKLIAAPKKAKKIIFTDPFIFHSVRNWIYASANPFEELMRPLVATPGEVGPLVESVVVSHFRRYFPCYYIKAQGEVDLAYVRDQRFFPVEIKWTHQIRPGEMKQVAKYRQGVILGKVRHVTAISGIPVFPLPLALLKLCIEQEAFRS